MKNNTKKIYSVLLKSMTVLMTVIIFLIILPGTVYLWHSLKPNRLPITITPRVYNLEFEDVTLETADGLNIAAWYLGAQRKDVAVILAHGLGVNREHMLPQAAYFVSRFQIPTLLIDVRGHGQSSPSFFSFGISEAEDIIAAIHFLDNTLGAEVKIGAYGFSAGTAAIMHAFALTQYPFSFLILESPALTNLDGVPLIEILFLECMTGLPLRKYDSYAALTKADFPILTIAGDEELYCKQQALRIANSNRHLLSSNQIISNAGHGGCWGPKFKKAVQKLLQDISWVTAEKSRAE
ncbi:alpha/beta hydrolase [candidate division CSSED10-310 bacterium]|uniref:Alpha/beta hydrolase n=1 Tax=candidate division CSSED10-310 bacterium TaxID=2855610 RepID=A0ABV6Z599_UNCC1